MEIREALDSELEDVLSVERLAFGQDAEAHLVRNLLVDSSAKPSLSLLAFQDEKPVGHILFTCARLQGHSQISCALLAPLAVIPDYQKQGIGGKLIQKGFDLLSESGVDLVFVLGYPEYYQKYGFKSALREGLMPPYPIPEQHYDAWMVYGLKPDLFGSIQGQVICADGISQPEYWRE